MAYLVVALLALGMDVRNATVRRLGAPDLTTTILTLTLTGLAADSQLSGGESQTSVVRRLGSVLAMLGGAMVGGLLLTHGGLALAPALAGLLLAGTTGAYLFASRRLVR